MPSDTILNESNTTSNDFPVLLNLTNKMKEIPGIENINYEIFISNNSMIEVLSDYQQILKSEGYSYNKEFSGSRFYESSNIYYHVFIKGINSVIIYLTNYNQQTWICYSTGNVQQYQEIFNYMISHDII